MSHDGNLSFSFVELWSPGVILISLTIGALYLAFTGPYRHFFGSVPQVGWGKKLLFLSGVITFYIALGSPLNAYGHHFLFSAHMMQQSILFFVVPPLILLGTPDWMLRPVLNKKLIRPVLRTTSNPIISILTFNVVLSFYHFPIIFDTMMSNSIYGYLLHTFLLLAAFQMWWIITCPVPEWNTLSDLKKIAYIVVNGVLLYPVCASIIFAGKPIYEHYLNAQQLVSFLNTEQDQQLGGVIMKLMQEGVLIFALGYTFFHWYRNENRNEDVLEQGVAYKGDEVL